MSYVTSLGQASEIGLLVPGLGIEHFFDLRLDDIEEEAGLKGGAPRTIEGPLWVAGAPLSKGKAAVDDGSEEGEALVMEGVVRDISGRPVSAAIVDMWRAGPLGCRDREFLWRV
jgi:catechol 1,2-dioxygenase